jgi:class 3 adenylate cyclase
MQETADWLEKFGMSEYAPRFAENGIDFGVLSDLTDQDPKEIGVLLGHRRKLLRAIADLGSASAAEHVPPPASAAPVAALTSALTEAAGERPHATVMFCDLVDSNGIASKLYAEKWHDLVGFYLNVASAVVTEMGGKVSKELGDGLIALFGYQVPQENDADDKIICRRLMTGE